MTRRLAAVGALAFAFAALALAIGVFVSSFPNGLTVFVCLAGAVAAGWYGVTHQSVPRAGGLGTAAVLLGAAVALIVIEGNVLDNILVLAGIWLALACASAAFAVRTRLSSAPRPRQPVLFMNPRSGGGKAERYHLADEARKRGIEPIVLGPGDDLRELVRRAVAAGADALAMAGGDGSQAIVATAAAERHLPYACIPAGTRNHFALDLGVDRDDVVGALDAFVDGTERRVDLAKLNGRVFVNNVSLGLYAEAVQQAGYRDAKLRTLLRTAPDALGQGDAAHELHWVGPEGREHRSAVVILVSNNEYRLGRALGSGTRPHIDRGVLGVTVVEAARADGAGHRPGWREWSTTTFEVGSNGPVATGVDGEAMMLDSPLRFEIVPGALRVRIASSHPGASPSAGVPESGWGAVVALTRIAVGHSATP